MLLATQRSHHNSCSSVPARFSALRVSNRPAVFRTAGLRSSRKFPSPASRGTESRFAVCVSTLEATSGHTTHCRRDLCAVAASHAGSRRAKDRGPDFGRRGVSLTAQGRHPENWVRAIEEGNSHEGD